MPRWTWRNGEIAGGPAALVDIDGVIADADHRQHLLAGSKQWASFFAAAADDAPLPGGLALLEVLSDDVAVILVTSRPESIHDETVDWLVRHDVRWDLLVMRSRRDHGPAADVKHLALEELRACGFAPALGVDDNETIVAMYRDEGVPALHVSSGY